MNYLDCETEQEIKQLNKKALMKKLILTAIIMSCGAQAFGNAPQDSKVQFPEDGNGVLDYCGVVVDQLDSRPSQNDQQTKGLKFGWCVGYLQATQEHIVNWRMSAGIQLMAQEGQGKMSSPFIRADETFVNTCIPNKASVAQLARVVVKWLREHPEKLHEPKSFLVMEALKDNFPCSAPKDAVKTAPVKP